MKSQNIAWLGIALLFLNMVVLITNVDAVFGPPKSYVAGLPFDMNHEQWQGVVRMFVIIVSHLGLILVGYSVIARRDECRRDLGFEDTESGFRSTVTSDWNCLSCGQVVEAGLLNCPVCNWSYKGKTAKKHDENKNSEPEGSS